MNELKFENAIELLINKFPQFKLSQEYKECDQGVTYLVYAAFCQYLIRMINSEKTNELLANTAFEFTNEMIEKGDKEMKTLAFTGIIENIVEDDMLIKIANSKLNSEGKKVLNELLNR